MRSSRGLAVRMLSASMEKVRYLVLMRPLLPRASWFCSICVYSTRMGSKSSPWGGMVMLLAKVSWDAARFKKDSWKPDGAVKVVEEVAPALEDGGFVLVLAELVVDVLELDGLGVAAIRHLADAVRPHPLIGDAVLGGGLLLFARAVGAGNRCLDLFAFGAGQLTPGSGLRLCRFGLPLCLCREQCHTPPCRDLPAAPTRRRSCWCGRGAAWAG